MPTYKLDSQGYYQPFPGYTVISKLNVGQGAQIWHNIFNQLVNNKNITDYYSILPLSSWHVTAINLFTKDALENHHLEWGAYAASQQDFLNELIQELKQNPLTPMIAYSNLYTKGALQIDVVLDDQSADRIKALAMYYGYEQNLPPCFHITLGYQYKKLNSMQLKALQLELAPLIQDYFNDLTLQIQPAQVCYFDDMTAFISLDKPFLHAMSMFNQSSHANQTDQTNDHHEFYPSKSSK